MLLAEGLQRRAEIHQIVAELQTRAIVNARYQEGDDGPTEDPNVLLDRILELNGELEDIVALVNLTNAATREGNQTITQMLARRDALRQARKYVAAVAAGAGQERHRFGREEIRQIPAVDVKALYARGDEYRDQLRDLDAKIQRLNWTTEMI